MNKTQHPSNNRVLGAPAGWDQKELPCSALPITDVTTRDGPAVLSFWRPSEDELQAMLKGEPVVLWVFGSGMPPVALEVGF